MGKCVISSENGEGSYNIKLIYDIERLESNLELIVKEITKLTEEINTLNSQLDVLIADKNVLLVDLDNAINDANENIQDDLLFAKQYEAVVNSYTDSLTELNNSLVLLSNRIAVKDIELASRQLEKNKLDEAIIKYKNPLAITVWCADRNLDITGQVNTIEINDEPGSNNSNILVAPGSFITTIEDSIIQPVLSSNSMAIAYNTAALPAVQKYQPKFRSAYITSLDVDNDRCNITFDNAFSSVKNYDGTRFDINKEYAFSNVSIVYMDCNAKAFSEGDHVIVYMVGIPVVIGFVSNPKECPPDVVDPPPTGGPGFPPGVRFRYSMTQTQFFIHPEVYAFGGQPNYINWSVIDGATHSLVDILIEKQSNQFFRLINGYDHHQYPNQPVLRVMDHINGVFVDSSVHPLPKTVFLTNNDIANVQRQWDNLRYNTEDNWQSMAYD